MHRCSRESGTDGGKYAIFMTWLLQILSIRDIYKGGKTYTSGGKPGRRGCAAELVRAPFNVIYTRGVLHGEVWEQERAHTTGGEINLRFRTCENGLLGTSYRFNN